LRFAPQAPASGRLAAAIATNSAIRRPIRDGTERSNLLIRAIDISSYAGGKFVRELVASMEKWFRSSRLSRRPAK
jgi:hypothetical protein